MFNRKAVVAAVAAVSLGFGSMCMITRADDKATAPKNPADPADKQTTDAMPSDSEMQRKMEMQEKMTQELMTNFTDADFVMIASMANADEIAAAKDVLAKTSNDDVKMFAQHMIDDHTKAGAEMKTLADGKHWTLSDEPDVKHVMAIKTMDKMSGADFDKSYATTAVADHEQAISLFKTASDKATDPDLKAFAAKSVPTFEEHLKMAQALEEKTSMPMK